MPECNFKAKMSNVSNAVMANVNVLSEIIDIRNGFTTCQILYNDDVSSGYYGYYCILNNCTIAILICEFFFFIIIMKAALIELLCISQAAIKEETSTSDNTQLEDPSTDEVRGQPESDGETEDTNDMDLSAISGTKCRVPHSHEWGEKQYCNALILGVEPFELDDTPKVR